MLCGDFRAYTKAARRSFFMTSIERREARYQRRKAVREAKRRAFADQYDNIERVADLNNLHRACRKARGGVMWKTSVQRYCMNELKSILHARQEIIAGKDIRKGFIEFSVFERGKRREIKSVHMAERVPQRALCQAVLIPTFARSLIRENGACLKWRGVQYQRDLLKMHLRKHFKVHRTGGYVLLFDFSGFFDSILHEPIRALHKRYFRDARLIDFSMRFYDAFGPRGFGLGSECSQIGAVAYPDALDHYIKQELGIKAYGRYMDDGYLIHESREYLVDCLACIRDFAATLGLALSPKKTQIVRIADGFRFLKSRYRVMDSGRIVETPWRASVTRMRRKLAKFKGFVEAGKMPYEDVLNAYLSWRGSLLKQDAHRAAREMDKVFFGHFGKWPYTKKEMKRRGLFDFG